MQAAGDEMTLGRMVKLLVAMLHKDKDKVPLPFRDQEPWHQLFYALKVGTVEPGKPEFFSELVFDWDGPSPKCQELSEYLNGLHVTGSVAGLNPGFEEISVNSDDATRWLKELKQLDQDVKSFVMGAAELARSEFVRIAA